MKDDRDVGRPGITTGRTVRRSGAVGRFQLLGAGAGEPVRARPELRPDTGNDAEFSGVRILRLVHMTDFQLADLCSPARVEYLTRLRGDERWAAMLPAYRPQEFTATTQVEAMARAVRWLADTERPVDLVITTGDNVDSQQRNELTDFVALMTGGRRVFPLGERPGATVRRDAGPVSARAAAGEDVPDWARVPDAPGHPGELPAWARPFVTTGVGAPWIACYGNHDALIQGRAPTTAALEGLLTGAGKPIGPVDDAELVAAAGAGPAIDAYVADPARFSSGHTTPVAPDPGRGTIRRAEFVAAQRCAGPPGQGFDARPDGDDRAYAAYLPHPAVKVLVLDTTNPGGYADGSLGAEQLRWLVGELESAHSRHLTEDGRWRDTGRADQLVVLCSHHGLSTLTNGHVRRDGDGGPSPGQDLPRVLAPDLVATLGRFPNVALWLSGHIHRNRVQPVETATGGFWEVTTSALIDWPCQARCLDLSVSRPGRDLLRVRCRQLDHRAAIDPDHEDDRVLRMASVGRRLAANVHDGVGGAHAEGTERDRNVDLFVPIVPALARRLRGAVAPVATPTGRDQP